LRVYANDGVGDGSGWNLGMTTIKPEQVPLEENDFRTESLV